MACSKISKQKEHFLKYFYTKLINGKAVSTHTTHGNKNCHTMKFYIVFYL